MKIARARRATKSPATLHPSARPGLPSGSRAAGLRGLGGGVRNKGGCSFSYIVRARVPGCPGPGRLPACLPRADTEVQPVPWPPRLERSLLPTSRLLRRPPASQPNTSPFKRSGSGEAISPHGVPSTPRLEPPAQPGLPPRGILPAAGLPNLPQSSVSTDPQRISRAKALFSPGSSYLDLPTHTHTPPQPQPRRQQTSPARVPASPASPRAHRLQP